MYVYTYYVLLILVLLWSLATCVRRAPLRRTANIRTKNLDF